MPVTGKLLQDKLTPEDLGLNLQTLNGHLLEQKNQARVLGLELDSELCFSPHADQDGTKRATRIGALNSIIAQLGQF